MVMPFGIAQNALNLGRSVAKGHFGAGTRNMAIGGAVGAAWGGVSSDTSVLGGALMGAGAARYGGMGAKAFKRGRAPGDGSPMWGGRQLAGRMAKSVYGGMKGDALMISNKAVNGFKALKRRRR